MLGRKVLDVVAPDIAEAHEARLLERDEQAAYEQMSLTWRRLGAGLSRATVTLPDASMDRWLTQLHAFTSPRREGQVPPDERVPHPRRLAQAFTSLLERIPTDWLPRHGGDSTTLVVTIDEADLDRRLAAAGLTTGTPITAGEARRLACTAGILPAVLGGDSQPLDLGRMRRLFSPAQRKALAIRDQTCRAEGCDVPAAWTEAHHLKPWARGGRPTWPTACCCAPSTITARTTTATTCADSRTATTVSTGGREGREGSILLRSGHVDADDSLVAVLVGDHGERGRVAVIDDGPTRGDGSGDPLLGHLGAT